jgi:hypothetical protein
MTNHSDDLSGRADRHSRLDQLEREIAEERERLNRADPGNSPSDGQVRDERDADERRIRPTEADHQTESVRTVDLPELEERVTESQREAWALGYQAGVADSQTRTGSPTQNPFHPLRGL